VVTHWREISMAFFSRMRNTRNAQIAIPEEKSAWNASSLPALVRQGDLALLAILVIIVVPEMRGMQFAQGGIFFYWVLAFVTFQLPCMMVFRWLARQAPARIPVSLWVLRLMDERWRSVLLYLSWWSGVLIVLPAIGICLDLLQSFFPIWFSSVLAQCLTFVGLLALATFFTCLPIRLFRVILWMGGLCYLAVFALLGIATLVFLLRILSTGGTLLHPALTILPQHFSWSLFGLALLSQLGVSSPLFLDGELRGTQRFLRQSTSYLWWAGCGALCVLLVASVFWVVVNPNLQVTQERLFLLAGSILGEHLVFVAEGLLCVGTFACALAFLFIFSRAFLLAARQHFLPHALARLNRAGIPVRAILAQSVLILGMAALLLVVAPALLRAFVPNTLLSDLSTGDHYGLLAAIAGSLWSLLTALLFVFALWLFWKQGGISRGPRVQRLVLPGMCVSGCGAALVCALAPLLPDWPKLFFSGTRWFPLIVFGFACSLALAWVLGELPRQNALIQAKVQSLARERNLHHQLQEAYDEQQILLLRQKVLLDEVGRLYHEQKQMAMTDQVTGLLNHQMFLKRLEEAIVCCQHEGGSCLLVFLDLDHFKAINDTWGHLAGDAVLRDVATRLQNALHPGDVAGRYGGEEFTLVLAGTTISRAQEEGERLSHILKAVPCCWHPTEETSIEIGFTASIGVAAYGLHGTQGKELLEHADQAMYQAKLAGRNCVRVADTRTPPGQRCS
jgi:diguanylate cyclase (GGDEF)-like protein